MEPHAPDPSACLGDEDVAALVAGALDRDRRRTALAHLDDCAPCRELVSGMARTSTSEPSSEPGAAPRPIAPGTLIGRYRIERPLGLGGMGVVYLADDPELGRQVALKLLNGEADAPGAGRERLARESRALARLSHPNVVTVYEAGEHDGRLFVAMEYVAGGTLREWLAERARRPAEIAAVMAQAAAGLAAAHHAGLVHRDFKPDNVLIGPDGRARVSDFGLARAVGAHGADPPGQRRQGDATTTAGMAGTPMYMAPELLEGGVADARSDQWSFAATLWEALTGAPAYPSDLAPGAATTTVPIRPPRRTGPPLAPGRRVPRRLVAVARRGLAARPADRWPSMDRLGAALQPRHRVAWVGAIAAAALALGLAAGDRIAGDPVVGACVARGDGLAGVWDAAHRRALLDALGGDAAGAPSSPVAGSVVALLDRYAGEWRAMELESCEAAERDPATIPQKTLRAACLEERRSALAVLVDALSALEPGRHAAALGLAGELPPVGDCASIERLARVQPLPLEPERRRKVVEQGRELDGVVGDLARGDTQRASETAARVAAAAVALDFAPLEARALARLGALQRARGDLAALETLRKALWAAERAGDDLTEAEQWIALLHVAPFAGTPADEVERMVQHATAKAAALARLDAAMAKRVRARLLAVQAGTTLTGPDPAVGVAACRRALAANLEVAGPDSLDVGHLRGNYAVALVRSGEFAAAVTEVEAAIGIVERKLGKDSADLPGMYHQAAAAHHFLGADDVALARIATGLRLAAPERGGSSSLRAVLLEMEADIRLGRGELAEAARLIDQVRPAVVGLWPARLIASLDQRRGCIAAGLGEPARGRPARPSLEVPAPAAGATAPAPAAPPPSPAAIARRLEVAGCLLDALRPLGAIAVIGPAAAAPPTGDGLTAARARFLLARAVRDTARDRARADREAAAARAIAARSGSASARALVRQIDAWSAEAR